MKQIKNGDDTAGVVKHRVLENNKSKCVIVVVVLLVDAITIPLTVV